MNVEPRKLPVYSASQIGDYTDCPRKWGLAKIDRLPKPQHASAKLGEAVHKQLERYLLGHGLDFASDPRAAEIAATMVEHLPPPNYPGMSVEASFTEPLHVYEMRTDGPAEITRPHLWTGRIDWTLSNAARFIVGDHKSTSNIDAYAKDTEALREDPQVLIYGMWALTIRPDLGHISFQWTYGQTRGAKRAQPEYVTLTRTEIEHGFAKIDAVAESMTRARESVQSGIELPYNADTCDKYGGCPFQARCNLSPIQRTPELPPMSNGPSFLEQLQRLGGSHANAAPQKLTHARNGLPLPPKVVETGMMEIPGSAPAAYRQLTAPLSDETNAIMDWVASDYQANPAKYAYTPPAPPQAPAWTPPAAAPAVAPPQAWTPPGAVVPPAINPPESALPPAPPSGVPAFVPPVATAPNGPPAWTPPAADKPKRGRPPKANGSTVAEAAESATLVDVLYMGCRPVGEAIAVEATEIIAKAHARLCADAKVADYGMIDFGKGPGTLCAYVEQTITMEYGGKSIVLDIETREGQALGTKLSSLARLTIRRM